MSTYNNYSERKKSPIVKFISFDIARGRVSYQIGRETFDIFVTDHAELLKLAKVGKNKLTSETCTSQTVSTLIRPPFKQLAH